MGCGYYQPPTEEKWDEVHRELNNLTRWLCHALDGDHTLDDPKDRKEFEEWWRLHQLRDDQVAAVAAHSELIKELKRSAATKLTPEERNALGLGSES
jgi:hypothetical protein